MSDHARRLWVLAYDVRDCVRLLRIHRAVRAQAVALQYSVFLYEGTRDGLNGLLQELQQLIDPDLDDLRAYPVPAEPDLNWLGREALPAGVVLLSGALRQFAPAPPAPGDCEPGTRFF